MSFPKAAKANPTTKPTLSKEEDVKPSSSNIENLPIRLIRVYQSVNFNKAEQTSFIVKGSQRRKPVSISINKELIGVEISNEADHIFIPMANIACIHFDTTASKASDEAKDAESTRSAAQNASLTDQSKKPR